LSWFSTQQQNPPRVKIRQGIARILTLRIRIATSRRRPWAIRISPHENGNPPLHNCDGATVDDTARVPLDSRMLRHRHQTALAGRALTSEGSTQPKLITHS
jgi:hypothetical protein